jgi:hypothetical protein
VYVVGRGADPFAPGGTFIMRKPQTGSWTSCKYRDYCDPFDPGLLVWCTYFPEQYFYGIYALSPINIYLAGTDGRILHYDGTGYTVTSSGITSTLRAMWGSSADYIFAVGDDGAIVHYNGVEWTPMESGTTEDLNDIWGSGTVVATLLQSWKIDPAPGVITIRWTLSDYDESPFHVKRTEAFIPGSPVVLPAGAVARDGMTFALTDRDVVSGGIYSYRIEYGESGSRQMLLESGPITVPGALMAMRSHPNPFNPATTITYSLPAACHVTLRIYDVAGKLVRTLVDGTVGAGTWTVHWDGTDDRGTATPSGVYFGRLAGGKEKVFSKLILAR